MCCHKYLCYSPVDILFKEESHGKEQDGYMGEGVVIQAEK